MTDETLIADLVRAGVEPVLIGRVANAILSASVHGQSADTLDNRRERDRARKRKERELLRVSKASMAANDTVVSAEMSELSKDKADNRCSLLTSLSSLKPSKEKKELVERGKRGTRLLHGAVISDTDRQFARDLGHDAQSIATMWSEFVDFWIGVPGQRGCKLDWSATWRNRVRAVAGGKGGNGGRPHNLPRPGSREDRQEKTYNAYQKLREYAHPQADESRDGDAARNAASGLLPFPKPT